MLYTFKHCNIEAKEQTQEAGNSHTKQKHGMMKVSGKLSANLKPVATGVTDRTVVANTCNITEEKEHMGCRGCFGWLFQLFRKRWGRRSGKHLESHDVASQQSAAYVMPVDNDEDELESEVVPSKAEYEKQEISQVQEKTVAQMERNDLLSCVMNVAEEQQEYMEVKSLGGKAAEEEREARDVLTWAEEVTEAEEQGLDVFAPVSDALLEVLRYFAPTTLTHPEAVPSEHGQARSAAGTAAPAARRRERRELRAALRAKSKAHRVNNDAADAASPTAAAAATFNESSTSAEEEAAAVAAATRKMNPSAEEEAVASATTPCRMNASQRRRERRKAAAALRVKTERRPTYAAITAGAATAAVATATPDETSVSAEKEVAESATATHETSTSTKEEAGAAAARPCRMNASQRRRARRKATPALRAKNEIRLSYAAITAGATTAATATVTPEKMRVSAREEAAAATSEINASAEEEAAVATSEISASAEEEAAAATSEINASTEEEAAAAATTPCRMSATQKRRARRKAAPLKVKTTESGPRCETSPCTNPALPSPSVRVFGLDGRPVVCTWEEAAYGAFHAQRHAQGSSHVERSGS